MSRGDFELPEWIVQTNLEASCSSSTLLLPSVAIPDADHEKSQALRSKLPLFNLTGVESVCVISYIQESQDKATKALRLAQYYRNIAENMRSEKLKKQSETEVKVKLVRNFWRNKMKGHLRQEKWYKKHLDLKQQLASLYNF